MSNTVILQLSDLHFGADHAALGNTNRDIVLQSLVESLRGLDRDWQPSVVVTTGDIGWSGRRLDYVAANEWFKNVASALNLPSSAFLFVPGNHDVDRPNAQSIPRPSNNREADRVFANGIPEHYLRSFVEFGTFCDTFGATKFRFKEHQSSLFGSVLIHGIRFVGINSCWCSQDGEDRNKLRLSRALIAQLDAQGSLLPQRQWDATPFTVVLMHHPPEWLHENDTSDWDDPGDGAYLYLASRAHLILCGHTHEVAHLHARAKGGGGIELRCGASFADAAHPNTFQLIRLQQEHIEYRQFEWIHRASETRWRSRDVTAVRLSDAVREAKPETTRKHSIEDAKLKLASFAQDYVSKKSRALSPSAMPALTPLYVERRIQQRTTYGIIQSEQTERLSLELAISETSRLLVWGDLGAGKSTLVGTYVQQANRDLDTIAILVPAANLVPIPSAPLEFLATVSAFVRAMILPHVERFDVRNILLEERSQVVFVIDGLDEIDNRSARRLLGALDQLLASFSRVRLVVTSRAVGNEYFLNPEWLEVTMSALSDEERLPLLINVALANGVLSMDAESLARSVLSRIRGDAVLSEAARSPMELRLLFQELRTMDTEPGKSLGAMLYTLLLQRLQKWEDADASKQNPTPAFCEALPSAESRLEALSAIATAILFETSISVTRADAILRLAPVLMPHPESAKTQALAFFEWTNIVQVVNERVEFGLRPLFEIACAAGTFQALRDGKEIPSENWRVVAFAAAIARMRGQLDELRFGLLNYMQRYRDTDGWILPSCYIAAESNDAELARCAVGQHATPLHRPLFALERERRSSAVSIAMAIHLAGDEGFEWFYERYLNPRYPMLHHGSYLPESVFGYWVSFKNESLSQKELQLLASIPPAHLETHSSALHRIVPLAILANPGSVALSTRARFLPLLLTHSLLSFRAEAMICALQNEHLEVVQEALWEQVVRGHENAAKAAELWLRKENATDTPPPAVIFVALRARGNWNGRFFSKGLWDELVRRLGSRRWERFCRWQTSTDSSDDAVGAVLYLSELHPERAGEFREILLRALHDGNRNEEAEALLTRTSSGAPEDFARWLARRIAECEHSMDRAHSGWWRILFLLLPTLGARGPVLLGEAIRGVGPFLLSRNADIRRFVRSLVGTPEGKQYLEMLEDRLRRGTVAQRYGAAQFLICLGRCLNEALLVCARARVDTLNVSWEWDQYCLSLRFPATAIEHAMSMKMSLAKPARLFVLALAAADGRKLDGDDIFFVVCNIDWIHSLVPLEALLADPVAFSYLFDSIRPPRTDGLARAAQFLLTHHSARLDEDARIHCEILAYDRAPVIYGRFLREFETDVMKRARVTDIGHKLAREYGRTFVIPKLAEASADVSKWRDVFWLAFQEDVLSADNELYGWALLSMGTEFQEHGAAIGRTARQILEEKISKNSMASSTTDEALWLSLLANEFGALHESELLLFADPYYRRPRLCSINAAVAARANVRREIDDVSRGDAARCVIPASLSDLADIVRMESIGDRLCEVIGRALYREHEPGDFEVLAAMDSSARVIAAILQYLYDIQIEPAWILKFTETDLLHRTARSEIWRERLRKLALQAFARLRREAPNEVRLLLEAEMRHAGPGCIVAGMLAASAGWPWGNAELATVLTEYGTHPYRGWRSALRTILVEVDRVLDRGLNDDMLKQAVAQSLDRLVVDHHHPNKDPLAFLVYAMLAWILKLEHSGASAAFRRGLSSLLVASTNDDARQENGADAVAESVCLLKRVDPNEIRSALTQYAGDEPDVVVVALLISSFLSERPAAQMLS